MNLQNIQSVLDLAKQKNFINIEDEQEILDYFHQYKQEKREFPFYKILTSYISQENIKILQAEYRNAMQKTRVFDRDMPSKKATQDGLQKTQTHIFDANDENSARINTSLYEKIYDIENISHYKVLKLLGSGAMGSVYLVTSTRNNQKYALKTILSSLSKEDIAIKRFQKEIEAMRNLRHPNIVKIYDFGKWKKQYYFTMNYIEGKPLSNYVTTKMTSRKIAIMITKIARALDYIHSKNIIHRDIKPENICVTNNAEPVIMDFGLAKHDKADNKLTKTGAIVGTPSYMAPEQVESSKNVIDEQTDIYALGITMYELMTGKVPFSGTQHFQVMRKIVEEDAIPPRELNNLIPEDLEKICLRAISKNKAQRFTTALEMAEDLERFIDGEPIKRAPKKITRKTKKKAFYFLLTAAALVLFTVINYIMVRFSKTPSRKIVVSKTEKMTNAMFNKYQILREKYSIDQLLEEASLEISQNKQEKNTVVEVLKKAKLICYFEANWKINQIPDILAINRFLVKKSYQEKYPYFKLDLITTCYEILVTLIKKNNFAPQKYKDSIEDDLIDFCHNHFPLHYKLRQESFVKKLRQKPLYVKYTKAFRDVKNMSTQQEMENIETRVNAWKDNAIKYYMLFRLYDEASHEKKLWQEKRLFLLRKCIAENQMHPVYIKNIADFYISIQGIENGIDCLKKALELHELYEKNLGSSFSKEHDKVKRKHKRTSDRYSFVYKPKRDPWDIFID